MQENVGNFVKIWKQKFIAGNCWIIFCWNLLDIYLIIVGIHWHLLDLNRKSNIFQRIPKKMFAGNMQIPTKSNEIQQQNPEIQRLFLPG